MSTFTALKNLLETYHEINGPVERLFEEPSGVEFAKIVRQNRPVIISPRGGFNWPALEKWSKEYLLEKMQGKKISVAETPFGNADSVVQLKSGESYFVKPYTKDMEFSEFMEELTNPKTSNVVYAQSQDNNLSQEFAALKEDLHIDSLSWAKECLGEPEASNVWIGTDRSVTAMHKDPFENLYMTVVGVKHFVILPPIAVCAVRERDFKAATYSSTMEVVPDDPPELVRNWPTVDPHNPENAPELWNYVRPIQITLYPGEMLYLPALWYHKVSQTHIEEEFCCAVNFWFEMDFSGTFFSMCEFVRDCTKLLEVDEVQEKEEMVEDRST